MSERWLKHLRIVDFRSIRGTIDVPLDANIVLVHGLNGAGKTSFMSALELGLTGSLASLEGSEEPSHLVHHGADGCSVEVTLESAPRQSSVVGKFEIAGGSRSSEQVLSAAESKFFRERAYLAQVKLGRLLEAYQAEDSRGASLLTAFVNDLLGLGALDALINGLAKSSSITSARTLSREFAQHDDRLASLESRLTKKEAAIESARDRSTALADTIAQALGDSNLKPDEENGRKQTLARQLEESEKNLTTELELKIELSSLNSQLKEINIEQEMRSVDLARAELRKISASLMAWESRVGPILLRFQQESVATLGVEAEPIERLGAYLVSAGSEISKVTRSLTTLLGEREVSRQLHSQLALERDETLASIKFLDLELAQMPDTRAAERSVFLSTAISNIQENICPVCDRDFAEVSTTDLAEHLRTTASELSAKADRIEAIQSSKSISTSRLGAIERDLESIDLSAGSLMSGDRLRQDLSKLRRLEEDLNLLKTYSDEGEKLRKLELETRGSVLESESRAQVELSVFDRIEVLLGNAKTNPASAKLSSLAELEVATSARIEEIRERNERIRAGLKAEAELESLVNEIRDWGAEISILRKAIRKLNACDLVVKTRVDAARDLSKAATRARQQITSEVFNDHLNGTWRDLFIRLAPAEPFVPRFNLVQKSPRVSKLELQALHRSGEVLGTPAEILSAGNLNTAALTLFLALNLVASPELPWILLDDPVQSMDDVHVSQVATVLRDLATYGKRQIIVAVHERPLYEYLKFELLPASESQSLMTIELSRNPLRSSAATWKKYDWEEDRVLA